MNAVEVGSTEVGTVYMTTDYGKFTLHKLNRPLEPGRVEHWKQVLPSRNLLRDNPFLVTSSFEVIDGQHRFMAAKVLGLAIYYIIAEQARMSDAASINSQNKVWTAADYLHSFCAAGNKNYMRLRELLGIYPFLKINFAVALMDQRDNKVVQALYRNGEFVIRDEALLHTVARRALDFQPVFRFWRDQSFLNALRNLSLNPAYDHDRMMKKMGWVGNRLNRCVSAEEYIDALSVIYNYRVRTDMLMPLQMLNRGGSRTARAQAQ